jgi:hypothetical protein
MIINNRHDLGLIAGDGLHPPTTSICHNSIARDRSHRL